MRPSIAAFSTMTLTDVLKFVGIMEFDPCLSPQLWVCHVQYLLCPFCLQQPGKFRKIKLNKNSVKLKYSTWFPITGIPRLPRFLVMRLHFARIFEAEFLYYKINIFLTISFGYTMIHIARISRNAVFCLPQKTR